MLSKFGRNQPRNLYLDKLSIKSEGRIKTLSDIQVLKFMTYKLFLRKILVIMLQQKNELNQERERYKVEETRDIAEVRGKGNSQGDEQREVQEVSWAAGP